MDIPPSIGKRLKTVHSKYGSKLPLAISCTIAPSRSRAKVWIELRHTGENEGVGIISWNGLATSRFRGESPENQFLETVKDSDFLDDETRDKLSKISVSNIQRLLGTPAARRFLGVNVSNRQLVFSNPEENEEALARMAIVVSDIANKHIKVTQFYTRDQRVSYAKAVAARDLPTPRTMISGTKVSPQPTAEPTSGKAKKAKRSLKRGTNLVPRALKLNIPQPRIAKIFGELQKLKIDDFENSCAVLLRVFLEMSLNEFAKKNSLSLKKASKDRAGHPTSRDMYLKEKVVSVVEFLVQIDPNCKNELRAIRTQAGTPNTIFSITNWHQYVHNQHYNPVASELRTIWDNIQPLFERVWA